MVIKMSKIIKNEFYKFFKSRKNIIIVIMFFVYLLGINFYNLQEYKVHIKETTQIYSNRRMQAEGILGQSILLLEKNEKLTSEEKEKLKREIEFYTVERNKLLVIAQTYSEDIPEKYRHILIAENDRYNNILNGIDDGVIAEDFLRDKRLTIEEMNKQMHFNKYIMDNEIEPMLNPYTMTGANSLAMFLDGNNLIILIFLIALLSVDIYLSEIEEGSYKLSYTQPFMRKSLFLGKIITIGIISLLLIVLGVVLNFIIVSIFYGIGNMNYPFITNESISSISFSASHGEYIILPLWKYIIMGFGLLLPILLFTISLIICISIFSDSSTKTLGFSIMLLVLAFIFNNFLSDQSIVNLIYPYCYLFVRNVIEVNNQSNYLFGILLNGLMAIVLFIMSYNKFVHKDYLGAKE